jgi:oligoribonuclease (3'-5' exoribonuclease)
VNFVWCDIETNGLDPLRPDALILEIALVAVDATLTEVAHWHLPIIPTRGDWFGTLPPELVDMHSNTGLLGELRGKRCNEKFACGGLPTLAQAEAVCLQFMQAYGGEPKSTYIAGANPAFDLGWIRKHMPALATRFSYHVFDTNAFHMASAWLAGTPMAKTGTRHRALDDCRASIQVVRSFFGLG